MERERERDIYIYKHMANSSKFPVCIVSRFLSCGYLFAHQPAVTSPVDGRKDIDKAIGSDKERGSKEGHSGRPD